MTPKQALYAATAKEIVDQYSWVAAPLADSALWQQIRTEDDKVCRARDDETTSLFLFDYKLGGLKRLFVIAANKLGVNDGR